MQNSQYDNNSDKLTATTITGCYSNGRNDSVSLHCSIMTVLCAIGSLVGMKTRCLHFSMGVTSPEVHHIIGIWTKWTPHIIRSCFS